MDWMQIRRTFMMRCKIWLLHSDLSGYSVFDKHLQWLVNQAYCFFVRCILKWVWLFGVNNLFKVCRYILREIMKFNRRLKIITVVSLLLASGVFGGLSGRPVGVLAAETEMISSGAVYGFFDGGESGMDDGGSWIDSFQLMGLAADSTGVTAFTFDGVMNPDADWEKLQRGVRISAVYTYENATGMETIVAGSGAMVRDR